MSSKVYYVKVGARDSTSEVSKKLGILIKESNVLSYIRKDDFTAIKMHFGDRGNTGHIRWEWAKEAAKHVSGITQNAFLTDSNVIYKASARANSVDHLKIASEHGFNLENIGVPVLIADGLAGRNFVEVPVELKHFRKIKMAADLADCDSLLSMAHVTGHIMTGMGAAIKNVGMGCSSRRGKYEQHCGAAPDVNASYCTGCGSCVAACPAGALTLKANKISISRDACLGCGECAVICKTKAIELRWSETLENLQEKMVEYAWGVIGSFKSNVGYINFLIKVTRDCDCLAKNDPRIVNDLGILASRDPVAIDKASADLINASSGRDVFTAGYPETDWLVHLKYAARVGLGSMEYKLEGVNG